MKQEPSLAEKGLLLLQKLKERSIKGFNTFVEFNLREEWPSIKAKGSDECFQIVNYLKSKKWVKENSYYPMTMYSLGWEAVQQQENARQALEGQLEQNKAKMGSKIFIGHGKPHV